MSTALVVLVLLLAVGAGWCVWTATRLDRLHLKVEAARFSLCESLQRRSSIAIELASTGLSDPASAVLVMAAAVEARDHADDWEAQSMLTTTLALVSLPVADALVAQLDVTVRQVSIARRIHNDMVARALDLRGRRRVRWFGLAGHAAPPRVVYLDDGGG
jgi:hypothetical protein